MELYHLRKLIAVEELTVEGCVRFGINIPPEWLQISTLVENTRALYPHITVEFISSVTQLITEALQNRTLDIGYIYGDSTYLKSRADEPLIRAITEQVTTLWQSEPELAIS